MTIIEIDKEKKQPFTYHNLIVSFTSSEEIIQFNKECELVTEYSRADVLHKKFSEILLPREYLSQWKSLLGRIQETLQVGEFFLPLKTRHNTVNPTSWTGFCIKNEKGSLTNICLLGTTRLSPDIALPPKQSDVQLQDDTHKKDDHRIPGTSYQTFLGASEEDQQKKMELSKEDIMKRKTSDVLTDYRSIFLHQLEKIAQNTSNQFDDLSEMMKDLLGKYDSFTTRLEVLEKNNDDLGKHLTVLENASHTSKETDEGAPIEKKMPLYQKEFTEKKSSFFSDPFGYKRQHRELDMELRELENRKKELDESEAQFLNDQKIFNARIEEFSQWRDKLEQLEMEIEKRRQELLEQDQVFFKEIQPVSVESQSVEPEIDAGVSSETPDYHQILDKIPQSAAIVQRGILKQMNTSFAELIGYPMHEIMEKNFFDFIADEGLAEIEKYYLNRLKGESITSYKTVISTKENNKVYIEVSVKPTSYHGEKAEIAIITGLEMKKQGEQKK